MVTIVRIDLVSCRTRDSNVRAHENKHRKRQDFPLLMVDFCKTSPSTTGTELTDVIKPRGFPGVDSFSWEKSLSYCHISVKHKKSHICNQLGDPEEAIKNK